MFESLFAFDYRLYVYDNGSEYRWDRFGNSDRKWVIGKCLYQWIIIIVGEVITAATISIT